jgi:hypothetical protein
MAMTDELVERAAARKSVSSEGRLVEVLESVQRLRAATGEDEILAGARSVFGALLGSAPATLRIVHDGGVTRRIGSEAQAEAVAAAIDQASHQGLPVLDDRAPGGVALPVRPVDRVEGVVYVGHPDAARSTGTDLAALRLAAAVVVGASLDLERRRVQAADLPRTISLHDAKLAFERRMLQARLDEARGNVAAAARSLDMDRGQLSRLMKKHNLDRGAFRQG